MNGALIGVMIATRRPTQRNSELAKRSQRRNENDAALCEAFRRARVSLIDVDLGGSVIK